MPEVVKMQIVYFQYMTGARESGANRLRLERKNPVTIVLLPTDDLPRLVSVLKSSK